MLGYKNNAGDIQYKKLAIKFSPEVRSYIKNRIGVYIFVGFFKCEAYDRYFVPQCFHSNEFNHFANNCPNKNNPGKCAGQHKTESCRSKFFECVNCIKIKVNTSKAHEVTSHHLPVLIREQNQIQRRTNYNHEKKNNQVLSVQKVPSSQPP